MVDVRRHAPVARHRAPRLRERHAYGLAAVSRGGARRTRHDIFEEDGAAHRRERPFRWLLSTLLTAVVIFTLCGIVVYGSLSDSDRSGDIVSQIEQASRPSKRAGALLERRVGLDWLAPKEERLQLATSALTIRQVIHDQVRVRRNGKPFLQIKPYLRLKVRLAPADRDYEDIIPAFNPLKLFSDDTTTHTTGSGADSPGFGTISTEIVDFLDGRLPVDDGQSFADFEIAAIVKDAIDTDPGAPSVQFGTNPYTGAGLSGGADVGPGGRLADGEGITILRRAPSAGDGTPISLERREVRVVTAAPGEALSDAVRRLGAPDWQARGIGEAAVTILQTETLLGGEQLHVTTVPSADGPDRHDVIKLSVFAGGHTHRVSVRRSSSGQFIASASPDQDALIRAMSNNIQERLSTLFAGVYATGLAQGLSPEQIMSIVRTHAHDVDFQRRIQPGDTLDLFFELITDDKGKLLPGEMVYTALNTSSGNREFWRFRSQDGTVDYFDRSGQNARKFLLRKPVRGGNVRLTSGYGMRRHPLLNRLRMHAGIDWAAQPGTPIMAAGKGRVTFAGRKGAYGNFITIRHANGYETAYAHMRRFASGIREGLSVRQGTIIGYVGTTGLSSGPHLHFEVRVNDRHVNPLSIKVGQERNLTGREQAEFQRERERISAVMRAPPVRTASTNG